MKGLLPALGVSDTSVLDYEALRAHVLNGSTAGSPSGLVLLLRQGVAAWTKHRRASPSELPRASPLAPPVPRSELETAVVRVLASMAMAAQEALPS